MLPVCSPHCPAVSPQKVLPSSTFASVAPLLLSIAGALAMISFRSCIVPVPGPAAGSVNVLCAPAAPLSRRL